MSILFQPLGTQFPDEPDLLPDDLQRLIGIEAIEPLPEDGVVDLGDRHGPGGVAHYLLDGFNDDHTGYRSRGTYLREVFATADASVGEFAVQQGASRIGRGGTWPWRPRLHGR